MKGITPACAGKTEILNFQFVPWRDHPRVCGENSQAKVQKFLRKGSPPRVRGKLYLASVFIRHFGITPACAGKTFKEVGACAGKKDHPRVCGENQGGA